MSPDHPPRPYAFLVSTPGGPAARQSLEALRPALEMLGTIATVAHPESSLAHAAGLAEAEGLAPIHLAIGGLHEIYLTPAVPTAIVPTWDYPNLPTVDLNRDGRLNARRVASRLDLILAPSRAVAGAFEAIGTDTTIVTLPIPARPGWPDLPTWGHGLPVEVVVPHIEMARADDRAPAARPAVASGPAPARADSFRYRTKRRLRQLKPYLSNATVQKLDGYKQKYAPILKRPDPARLLKGAARRGYRGLVRRWISDDAHRAIAGAARRLRGRPAPVANPTPPPIGPATLRLSGLVYSARIDYADPTRIDVDILSPFLHAFRDREDITLVLRLDTTPKREAVDLARLAQAHRSMNLTHRCRIVVVVGPVDPAASLAIGRASSYEIESSRTTGRAAEAVEAMAAGRPVVGPAHSGLADWLDEETGFPVATTPEPTSWPIDPHARPETTWHRPTWESFRDQLAESARVADDDPGRYESLSATARQRVADRAGIVATTESLRSALARIEARPIGSFSWD